VDVGFKPTGTEVEMRYMQSWEIEDIRFEQGHASGLAEGLTQGESKGKMDSILLLLSNLEEISEDLKIKIQAQQDQKVLDQWLVYAAKAKSIPEFEESIKQQ
jgi:flagellar biosynthesis/type III secretory pathway protein FliH